MKKSICFLLFFILFFSVQAQVQLKNNKDSYVIGESISYLKDPTGLLTLDDILYTNQNFIQSEQKGLSFGFTKDAVWIKCIVTNQSNYQDWVLSLGVHYINYLDFYYQEEGVWQKMETGSFLPFDTKEFNYAGFAFPLNSTPKSQKTYYLRLTSVSPLTVPLHIQRYKNFYTEVGLQKMYYGAYFGILLVMFFYNLFIYFSLKDKNYLYYTLTIIATLAMFSSSTGYAFMLIWPETPALNVLPSRIFMSFVVITTALFSIQFLQLKKDSRFLYYWMIFNIVLACVASVLHHFTVLKSLTNSVVSFHIIALLASGVVTWRKGNPLAKYYFSAWFFYFLGGALITFRNNGLLASNLLTGHAVEVGSVLEVIIISIALSEKYKIFKREKKLANKKILQVQKEANEQLENKVQERTSQLKTSLEVVNRQNIDINASINYASRIQEAFLAMNKEVKKVLPEYFLLFKPRDLVSGDFFFFMKKGKKIIIAVADCTGHGIPGAMMSMIGYTYLSQTIHFSKFISADEILSQMHDKIRSALSQDDESYTIQDGMDMAICIIDKENKTLEFAGAKRPLLFIKDNKIHEIKGSKLPIGGRIRRESHRVFEKHTLEIDSEMTVYLSTDGFYDQFGGKENKKFMSKRFKNLLLENHTQSLMNQEQILEESFLNWKGKNKQIDDVLVVGFKLDKSYLVR